MDVRNELLKIVSDLEHHRRMAARLLTPADLKALPPLYAQDGKGMNAVAYVKLFHPATAYTMFVTEFDKDGGDTLFGWSTHDGHDGELGYSSLREISSIRAQGIGVERDRSFRPMPLNQAISQLLRHMGKR